MAKKRSTRRRGQGDGLYLRDAEGRLRIALSATGDVPCFQMLDADERPRINMQIEPDGRTLINLMAANGRGLVNIGAKEDGAIGFSLERPDGAQPIIEISWTAENGLQLRVWDQTGRPIWTGSEPGPR